jgi:hypothetical protein
MVGKPEPYQAILRGWDMVIYVSDYEGCPSRSWRLWPPGSFRLSADRVGR